MGPVLIFDKSALESLNPDEAAWLDNFYLTNITPLFFIETLSDLEKNVRNGRTPEEIVGNIANKTPDYGAHINAHHEQLLRAELIGRGVITMDGRPSLSEGQPVVLGNETGVIFQKTREMEAFQRWQKHDFLDLERTIAKKWRRYLKDASSGNYSGPAQQVFGSFIKPSSLDELKKQIDKLIESPEIKNTLVFGLLFLNINSEDQEVTIQRWNQTSKKSLKEFAPYFVHVLSVDLFFRLGTFFGLLSGFPHSETHWIDVAYLYYLPFCHIFVSGDKFHLGVAPYFLRPNQTIVKGEDLKADLAALDKHYSQYPEDVKERGIVTFAAIPPDDAEFLTTQMWDKYMNQKWRDYRSKKFDGTDQIDIEKEKQMVAKIERFAKESIPLNSDAIKSSDEVKQILITRDVYETKGKWKRFPPEVINSKKRIC